MDATVSAHCSIRTVLPEQLKERGDSGDGRGTRGFYFYVLYFRSIMPLELLSVGFKYMHIYVCAYVDTCTDVLHR